MPEDTSIDLDELDLALLRELEIDGRQPAAQLAKKLGVSRNHLSKRLQRLLNENVTQVVGITRPGKLGLLTSAMIGIKVAPKELLTVAARLTESENVHVVVTTAGRQDIMAWAVFEDTMELSRFLEEYLANIPGITETETTIALKTHKLSFSFLKSKERLAKIKE